MTFKFAYTNTIGYDYDPKKAKTKHALVEFTFEIAQVAPVKQILGKPLTEELLDGNVWELQTRYRKSQSFTTFPDIMLYTIKASDGKTYRAGDLIRNWWMARSRWINNMEIYPEGDVEGYAKVIRVSGDFAPEQQLDVFFMQSVTLEYQTSFPYSFGN